MYDIIIIGAGPSGLSAAIYGQRAGKTTLIFDEKGFGGQIVNTPEVENYPGIRKISGVEFAKNLYEQAIALGSEIKFEKVIGIEDNKEVKRVKTAEGYFDARAVIIATGAKNRPLGIEKEDKFVGSGISYCAACDGAFFRGRDVAVIGGGNTALEDAEVLAGIANKVYLIHRRDSFRGEEANVLRLKNKENVELILDSVPLELLGENVISGLKIKNLKTDKVDELKVSGIFVAVGQMPANEDFKNVVTLDVKGYVAADESCLTPTKGIFVSGDCRTKKVRQLATATSDGAIAAISAVEYMNGLSS